MRSSSCLLLLLLALPASAAPQTPPVPHAAESVEVSIVNVDAVVVDKQGHRVQGLRRDDFDIFENGVRQPITNFAECSSTPDEADLERAKKGHFTYTVSVASLTPSLHVAFGVYDEVSRDYAVRLVDLESPSSQ